VLPSGRDEEHTNNRRSRPIRHGSAVADGRAIDNLARYNKLGNIFIAYMGGSAMQGTGLGAA